MRLIITSTPSSSPIDHVNALRGLEAEPLERARPLHGEQRVLVGDVTHVGAAQLAARLSHAKTVSPFDAFATIR